jgi:multidrug resistance efflux pump
MAEVQANTKNNKVVGRILIVIVLMVLVSGDMFWLPRNSSRPAAQVDGQIYAISSRISSHVINVKVEESSG